MTGAASNLPMLVLGELCPWLAWVDCFSSAGPPIPGGSITLDELAQDPRRGHSQDRGCGA